MTKHYAVIEPLKTPSRFGTVISRHRERDAATAKHEKIEGWFNRTYVVRRLRVMAEVGEVIEFTTLPKE